MTAHRTIARRLPPLAALLALLLTLPTGAAQAAGTTRITSPPSGATLTEEAPLVVEVRGRNGTLLQPEDHEVDLRLTAPGGAEAYEGTSPVAASCKENCHEDSTWRAGALDPATLAPLGDAPSCNGAYTLQARVDGGAWTGHTVRIARPPAAPADVAARGGAGQVTVTWDGSGDPDVVGYRVERRRANADTWTTVTDVAPDTRSVTDGDVRPGEVSYRVLTVRGDGMANGVPAAPCSDTEPDLATASAPVTADVRSTASADGGPSEQGTSSPDDGTEASGSGGSGGSGSSGTNGGNGGNDGSAAGSGSNGSSSSPRRSSGPRVAPPTAVGTSSGPQVGVQDTGPNDPEVAAQEETYYGEGEEFSEELDFGDLGAVEAMPEGVEGGESSLPVPVALQNMLADGDATRRVAVPAAGGLIMLAVALHLRRWTREGLEG